MASPLQILLEKIRVLADSEREKGDAFENLCICYLQTEPKYSGLYAQVQKWANWVEAHGKQWGLTATDKGIDLVATTHEGTFHAIQCKFYTPDHVVSKADIDSFISASGHKAFVSRILIDTTQKPWGSNAEEMLANQHVPVMRINLADLENSAINWSCYQVSQPEAVSLKAKHVPRPHQQAAIEAVLKGLQTQDRGKLIMACGTGKTFTALKIAEQQAGAGKQALFLVPSLALLSQTLSEWSQQSQIPITAFAVCSDSEVGKKRLSKQEDDDDQILMALHELAYPATTNAASLAKNYDSRTNQESMSVIFATYHSIAVIEAAQKEHGLPEFDLVICDEAHRTTGQTWKDDKQSVEESHFVRIHDNGVIKAKKRLYMTATPRIFNVEAQKKAETAKDLILYSMDNEELYGKTLHVLSFSSAVEQELLVPYKVIVLTVEEKAISQRFQNMLNRGDNSLNMDDVAKIVGCFKALAKQGLQDESEIIEPMRRAVAFCQVVDRERTGNRGKGNKVAARQIADMFQAVVKEYQNTASEEEKEDFPDVFKLRCEATHVHGGMGAAEKTAKLDWLKQEIEEENPTCRILTNVRCLSEGVDVPALDAVLFLTPRNSQVEVVQAVGRVMRRAEGKKRGYIILPVVIPSNKEPHQALNDNRTYKVVWQVLKALKAHDDEFDRFINRIDLLGADPEKIEIIAQTGLVAKRKKPGPGGGGGGRGSTIGEPKLPRPEKPEQLTFEMGELERAIVAKVVDKMADRDHWQQWATDIARIAQIHIEQIGRILDDSQNHMAIVAFDNFTNQLHQHINQSIVRADIIEMLAQHLITRPVFDALFGSTDFTANNPISAALQKVSDILLKDVAMDKERASLEAFYENVRKRSSGIEDPAARQKLIITLYDTFFASAFPRIVQKHGIVYTPVELVDFILHSVAHLLKTHFGKDLASKDVQILDPFTGTGTFLVRLLQSGLISPAHLPYVYANQLHANEILLLPYYIAAVNIESALAQLLPDLPYMPFPGILLADSFNIPTHKPTDMVTVLEQDALAANNARRKRQMESKITVIIGNPPYSGGQRSQNDNNQNVAYPELDRRIEKTYVAGTQAINKNALYDSYIRAIRWGSDRIDAATGGIIGFVTNAGWLDSTAMNGLRTCLTEEFSSLYVFHLRGDARTQGEQRKKESGNVFEEGSRAPIALSILVKSPHHTAQTGQIYFHDIGDYLSTEGKLQKIAEFGSIDGIEQQGLWQQITPDKHGDWLNQRAGDFDEFLLMGDKKYKNKPENRGVFINFSNGVKTQRDVWCNNPSKAALLENVGRMIEVYETERLALQKDKTHQLDMDPAKISWSSSLLADVNRDKPLMFNPDATVPTLYRPFAKGWLYYDRRLNERVYQMPQIFPLPSGAMQESNQAGLFSGAATQVQSGDNRLICVSGVGSKIFSVLMTDMIPSLDCIEKGQCFPLYTYDKQGKKREAITDATLTAFRADYPEMGKEITKEAIFYYIYGLLHEEGYRQTYAHNLTKELPRIPFAANAADFMTFVQAGRQLADLHIGFETGDMYEGVTIEIHKKDCISLADLNTQDFYVEKMKYGKTADKKKDLSVIHYNRFITIRNIPVQAYDYVVNGRAALDWVVERQGVRPDKASSIMADANLYATQTMQNAKYSLELILRIITLSLKTRDIVQNLPKLS